MLSETCQNSLVTFLFDNRWLLLVGIVIVLTLFTIFIVSRITTSVLHKNEKMLWISMAAVHLVVLSTFFAFGSYIVFSCSS